MASAANPTSDTMASERALATAAAFRELVSGCGIYALHHECKVILTGEDRVRWLNGMVTNNVRDLAVGQGVYAFLLNPQGHIQADLSAYQRGADIVVVFDSNLREKILGLFEHYIISDDVTVTDASDEIASIGISGPTSVDVLSRAGVDVAGLHEMHFAKRELGGVSITLLRGEGETKSSWEIWSRAEDFGLVWTQLIAAGAKAVGDQELELFRISRGIPRYGQDIRERDLPQETQQGRALHFAKGCYVGQEIVERIRSRGAVHRVFTGFTVSGPLPERGTPVRADGKDVGEITSTATLPFESGDRRVALGYIRREAMAGKELLAGEASLKVSPLPFLSS